MQSFALTRTGSTTVLALLLAIPATALAWGKGHQNIVQQTFAQLPRSIIDQIPADAQAAAIKTYALYPDSFLPLKADEVGRQALDKLAAFKINNRYAFHTDLGRAMSFVLLVDAFRHHEYTHAAIWIAILSHSTADMAAINHDPLVHSVIYTAGYHLRLPGGQHPSALGVFDISDLVGEDEKTWEAANESSALKDDGRDARTALLDIMKYGQEGADFCASRGVPILSDAIEGLEKPDAAVTLKARQSLAELGAWAVARTVRDTEVAARLAASGDPVEMTPAVQAAFVTCNDQYLHDRKLTDDAIFSPILRPLPAHKSNVVGVVLEPTWRMNDAFLGYGDRVLVAAICRSFQLAGRPYSTLDVREVLHDGFPPPANVPVVVLSATALRNYGWMHTADLDRQLSAYLKAGGKLIWIGGDAKPPQALAAVDAAMTRTPKQLLPATELLHGDAELHKTSLLLIGAETPASWPFVRPPSINVGWTQPLCPWRFEALGAGLIPLLQLKGPDPDMTVGVLWKDPVGGKPQGAYLPVYSLSPHLLVASDVWTDPAKPQLEAPALQILTTVIDRLETGTW